jgi:hypothetical protein
MFTMMSMRTMFAGTMPLSMLSRPMRFATFSSSMMRRTGGAHAFGLNSVHDPVKLVDDAVETHGRIVPSWGPLMGQPFFGRPGEMQPACQAPEHHDASGQGEPFQRAIHRRFSS